MRTTKGVVLFCVLHSFLCAGPTCAAELKLGQIASVSSVSAGGLAVNLNLGFNVYFDKLNQHGGVNGNTVKVVLRDDALKADNMLTITREFIADKSVIGLVGFINTPGMTEIGKQNLLVQGGIALVAPVQGDKRVVSAPNFFPFRSGYLDEVSALVREAKQTQKQRVFLVYQSTTLGPPTAAFAEEEAKRVGVPLIGKVAYDNAPDKFAASARSLVDQIVKSRADAVLLVASGAPAFNVVSLLHDSPAEPHVVYGLSLLQVSDIPPSIPVAKVHGVVVAQSVPYPYSGLIPIVREYQRAMKEMAPDKSFDYFSLEGFIGAKICHEALKRAGKKVTRQSFLAALQSMGEIDLGGVSVNYSDKARLGWGGVDLTIIDRVGRLQH